MLDGHESPVPLLEIPPAGAFPSDSDGWSSVVKVVPFERRHLDSAAELLARVQKEKPFDSAATSMVAEPSRARQALSHTLALGFPSVAAIEAKSLIGFMLAPLPALPGESSIRIPDSQHAAEPTNARAAYRAMYTEVAQALVIAGCFTQVIHVPAVAKPVIEALFELGFGMEGVKGTAALPDLTTTDEGASVRAATIDDLDGLVELAIGLQLFHAASPVFKPALLDVPLVRADLQRAIQAERSSVLVAHDAEGLIGFMEADPDGRFADTLCIGMNVVAPRARGRGVGTAILHAVTSWATAKGFTHCSVGWGPANIASDAFYRSRGFRSTRHQLVRHIDQRIAWANQRLDYGLFRLR